MEVVKSYKRRLVTFSYNYRAFFSGSSSEIPIVYLLTNPTDFDFMMYRADVCAIPENTRPPSDFDGEVLTIEPQRFSVGYAKLRQFQSRNHKHGRKGDYKKHLQTFSYDDVHGPAVTTDIGWSAITFDKVFSVQCPYWPSEAEEWKTRHRQHGWPSKDLIHQIVSEGCYLVGKSHPNFKDDDETQWRYSFSKAETRLISTWTDSQMYVYHVLRLIKAECIKRFDDETKSGLCTYHLKTQMFWACEECPAEFWDEGNLLNCICELLRQLEQRFITTNFPNYFIRDCNIIEGISIEGGLIEGMRMLGTGLGRVILKSKLPPKLCHECRISMFCPLEMALYCQLIADRFGIPIHANRQKLEDVPRFIDEKLDDLMNGIYNMQLAKTLGRSYYATAEQHFWQSIDRGEAANVKRVELSHSASLNIVTGLCESLGSGALSTCSDESHKFDLSVGISCTVKRCPYAGRSLEFSWNESHGYFNEKWMNPSHLLSAAYLVNFYWITGNLNMCNEMGAEERILAVNASFSELFPMIFSPELASLFDQHIQVVLGFIWLRERLLGSARTFEFCTCPLLFILYIGIQSSLRLGDMTLIKLAIEKFQEHRAVCNFRLYLDPHHDVLLEMAWRIHTKPGQLEAIGKLLKDSDRGKNL